GPFRNPPEPQPRPGAVQAAQPNQLEADELLEQLAEPFATESIAFVRRFAPNAEIEHQVLAALRQALARRAVADGIHALRHEAVDQDLVVRRDGRAAHADVLRDRAEVRDPARLERCELEESRERRELLDERFLPDLFF